MAEIKSTLDLVMEKTRGLRMSEAEKDAQRRAEFYRKVNGVVQRFEDGQLRLEEADAEISLLMEPLGVSGRGHLATCLGQRFDLERDNRALLALIRKICGAATETADGVLREYREAVQSLEQECARVGKQRLRDEHRISGSAVAALAEADPGWRPQKAALQSDFGRRLEQALSGLAQRCSDKGNTGA
jgi:hypothetical protein